MNSEDEREIARVTANTNYNIQLQEMPDTETVQHYSDSYCLLPPRRHLMLCWAHLRRICRLIIFTRSFENLVLSVIILNSFKQLTADHQNSSTDLDSMETFFIIFYTGEMLVKMMGMGLYARRDSYLRDVMNILDLLIVLGSLIPIIMSYLSVEDNGNNDLTLALQQLRTLRILRPLKTIKNIQALQKIMRALSNAMSILINVIIIQWMVYLLFAVTFMTLLKGSFKQMCFQGQYGLMARQYSQTDAPQDIPYCHSSRNCPPGFLCGKQQQSSKWDTENFDNLFNSLINVYQIISLEGWSDILYVAIKTTDSYLYIGLFWIMIIFGAFFYQNLTIAILGTEFQMAANTDEPEKIHGQVKYYNLKDLQRYGIYNGRGKIRKSQSESIIGT